MAEESVEEIIERAARAGGTSLVLRGRGIGDEGARAIAERLPALTSLDLAANGIGAEGARAIVERLPALTSLDLSFNGIGAEGARAIAERLPALTSLNLSLNGIGAEGARAIAERLPALTSLHLSQNRIGDEGARAIAERLPALTSLGLSDNGIGDEGVRAIVHQLLRLQVLDLSHNQLSTLPEEIGHLKGLEWLALAGNDLRALPSVLLGLPKLRDLFVHQNPRLNLPPEIARQTDPATILAWYFGRKRRLNEAKVLMVGQGGVGKTSLVSAIMHDHTADPEERKTERIRIDTWSIPSRHEGEKIRVNVWDFGGQEIMHATHQFFLTKRSVYVLVLDARQGEIESNIHYWLQTIQTFGGDSPVLVVTNKCDVQPLSLNENGLKRQYAPMEIGFHRVSCKNLEGIADLRTALSTTLQGLAHVGDELPETYFNIKADLEQTARDRHYFDMAEYAALCVSHKVKEEREQRRLLRFLHDLGTVLNFDDPDSPYQVGDTNILNPEWVTEAVYAIINNQPLMQAQGQLDVARLPEILHDETRYPRDKQRFVVEMMRKFELCFGFPDRPGTLLVPELLSKNEPDLTWKDPKECLGFEYGYAVLPSGLLPRFIVRMHHALTDKPTYWRSGVVLAIDGCKVLISGDTRANVVRISVDGPVESRRSALSTVRNTFKAIHATMPKLNVEERLPLPDAPNVTVPYDYLLGLEERSRSKPSADTFIPQGLPPDEQREYSARQLLSGIQASIRRTALPRVDNQDISATAPTEPSPNGSESTSRLTRTGRFRGNLARFLRVASIFLVLMAGMIGAIIIELRLLSDTTSRVLAVCATGIVATLGLMFLARSGASLSEEETERLIERALRQVSLPSSPEPAPTTVATPSTILLSARSRDERPPDRPETAPAPGIDEDAVVSVSKEQNREIFLRRLAAGLNASGLEFVSATFGRTAANTPVWNVTVQTLEGVRSRRMDLDVNADPYAERTCDEVIMRMVGGES